MFTKRIAATLILMLALTPRAPRRGKVFRPRQARLSPISSAFPTPDPRDVRHLVRKRAKVLADRFVDVDFRTKQLPALVERYRAGRPKRHRFASSGKLCMSCSATSPLSHLGLLSRQAHRTMMADLAQAPYPSFGFQAIGSGANLYAGMILEGGPAARAGLLVGDRLVTIDGTPIEESTRLDWRTDDAFIGDERDPAVRYVIAAAGDRIALRVERRQGEFVNVTVTAEEYTAFDAAEASVRVIRTGDMSIGYVHFWYVHMVGVPDLIKRALEGRLKNVNALVIDLRGRGGSATEIAESSSWLMSTARKPAGRSWRWPTVSLVARRTCWPMNSSSAESGLSARRLPAPSFPPHSPTSATTRC
jgi:hypothetical protein